MTTITPIYVQAQPQQPQSKHKVARHVVNTGITAAGGLAIAGCLDKGIRQSKGVWGDAIALTNGTKSIKTKTGVIFNFFEKAGQKLFKEGSSLGRAMERYVTGNRSTGGVMSHAEQIKATLKHHKTIGAMNLAAVVAALALLARGIYNAGKINAE